MPRLTGTEGGQFTEIHIHTQTRIVICFLCYESPVLYDINQCFFFYTRRGIGSDFTNDQQR